MKMKHIALKTAIAAAMGLAANAGLAATLTQGGTLTKVPYEAVGTNTATVTAVTGNVPVLKVAGTETYVGRNLSFTVTYTLSAGKFDVTPTMTTDSVVDAAAAANATYVAGGADANYVTFSIDPTTAYAGGTLPGDATFTLSDVVVDNAASALGVNGGSITIAATLKDPNLGTTLESVSGQPLVSSAEGLKVTIAANSAPKKIDVAQDGKFFTDTATKQRLFDAGSVTLAADDTLQKLDATGAIDNAYMQVLLDKQTFTLSGVNLAPFTKTTANTAYISLEAAANCPATATANTTFTVTDGTAALSADLIDGTTRKLCLAVDTNNAISIEEGTPSLAVAAAAELNAKAFAGVTGTLAKLEYNGYTANFNFMNAAVDAASNYASYFRIANTSGIAGDLRVSVTKDDGSSKSETLVQALGAGKTVLIDAGMIEAKTGALSTGEKGRVKFFGLFPSGNGMAFMMNPGGVLTNMSSDSRSNGQ